MTDGNTLGSVAIVVHGAFHDQGRGQCGRCTTCCINSRSPRTRCFFMKYRNYCALLGDKSWTERIFACPRRRDGSPFRNTAS